MKTCHVARTLHADSQFFQHRTKKRELNVVGIAINAVEQSISQRLNCSGTMWICRKPTVGTKDSGEER